jgi:hypothetical protein
MTSELIKKKVTLHYGKNKGAYTFSGLKPDAAPLEVFITAEGLNLVQTDPAEQIVMTTETRLTR